MAADVKLVPSCEVKEEFNDNVFLTAAGRKSDFISTLSPSLALSHATERLNIDLLTGLGWHEYARTSGIGTTDYQYAAQMTNKLTLRDELGLSAVHIRSNRPDTISQSTALSTGTGSDHNQYSANVKTAINETTSAILAYSFVKDTYDNPASLANHVHTAGLVVSKDFGAVLPLLKGTLSTNFSRAIYRNADSDNYSLKVGASRNFNEKLSMELSVGGQVAHSTYVTTSEVSNNSWGLIGSASLSYTGEKRFASCSFARNFSAASGQVGAVETTSFGVALGHKASDKTTAQVSASYNINQASRGQFSPQSTDSRVLNLRADIAHKFSKYFDLGLQYVYYTANNKSDEVQIAQNSVMLRAVARYPVSW